MGGWMSAARLPSLQAENLIRQMEAGREYFREKFREARPTNLLIFDPFGHSRGWYGSSAKPVDSIFLPSGTRDCLCRRMISSGWALTARNHLALSGYIWNPLMGEAGKKVERSGWVTSQKRKRRKTAAGRHSMLWGVKPRRRSRRVDLEELKALKERARKRMESDPFHAPEEAYFAKRREAAKAVGKRGRRVEQDLNSWALFLYLANPGEAKSIWGGRKVLCFLPWKNVSDGPQRDSFPILKTEGSAGSPAV